MKVIEYRKDAENKERELLDIISTEINCAKYEVKYINNKNKILKQLRTRSLEGKIFPLTVEEEKALMSTIVAILFPSDKFIEENRMYVSSDEIDNEAAVKSFIELIITNKEGMLLFFNEYNLNQFKIKLYSCKKLTEVLSMISTMKNDDRYKSYIMFIYKTFIDTAFNYIVEINDDLYDYISNLSELRKIIIKEEIINDEILSKILKYDKGSNIYLDKILSNEVVLEYNNSIIEKKKNVPDVTIKQPTYSRHKKTYPNREQRMKNYQKDIEQSYVDAGEIELNGEEKECIEIYLSIIEDLKPNQIEDFINRTSNYLEILLPEDNPYPKIVIESLIDRINLSASIEEINKRGICKAIRHLM